MTAAALAEAEEVAVVAQVAALRAAVAHRSLLHPFLIVKDQACSNEAHFRFLVQFRDIVVGMVLQKAVDNLKDRPHDEKKAVAGGIAITLVVVLLLGWGFLFLRKIQKGAAIPTLQGSAIPADQFDPTLLKQAQQQYEQSQNASPQTNTYQDPNHSVDAPVGGTSNAATDQFGSQ